METTRQKGNTDKYGIYQLKENFDAIKPGNYNLVYVGELSELSKDFIRMQTQGDTLDAMLPYVIGQEYANIPAWGFILFGAVALAVIFIIHYVQYSCTYIGTYKESARRRISIAEHLRKLTLSFFCNRDIAELTGTIMGDCAGFEHAFPHTVPQFYGAVISTVLVC